MKQTCTMKRGKLNPRKAKNYKENQSMENSRVIIITYATPVIITIRDSSDNALAISLTLILEIVQDLESQRIMGVNYLIFTHRWVAVPTPMTH